MNSCKYLLERELCLYLFWLAEQTLFSVSAVTPKNDAIMCMGTRLMRSDIAEETFRIFLQLSH